MQVREKRTCSVVNSPAGTNSQSLSGFFRGFVRCFGSKNRIGVWAEAGFCEWFSIWEVEIWDG